MIVVMFSAVLTRYLGNGPFFPTDGFEMNMCRYSWWANLLYVNNFVQIEDLVKIIINKNSFFKPNRFFFKKIISVFFGVLVFGK